MIKEAGCRLVVALELWEVSIQQQCQHCRRAEFEKEEAWEEERWGTSVNSTWLTRCDNSGTSSRGRPHYLKSKKKAEEEEAKASGTADYHNNRTLGYESSERSWQQSQEQLQQKINFFLGSMFTREIRNHVPPNKRWSRTHLHPNKHHNGGRRPRRIIRRKQNLGVAAGRSVYEIESSQEQTGKWERNICAAAIYNRLVSNINIREKKTRDFQTIRFVDHLPLDLLTICH